MENASKALLMAGGILIAIVIIALLTSTLGTINLFKKSQITEEEEAQLVKFNEQYTKYLGQYVYGTEVITVINMAQNNKSHKIKIIIEFANDGEGYDYAGYVYNPDTKRYEEGRILIQKGSTLEIVNDEENNPTVNNFINSLSSAGQLNTMAFKCTDIKYDSYGRVNSIKFVEKKWGDLY